MTQVTAVFAWIIDNYVLENLDINKNNAFAQVVIDSPNRRVCITLLNDHIYVGLCWISSLANDPFDTKIMYSDPNLYAKISQTIEKYKTECQTR